MSSIALHPFTLAGKELLGLSVEVSTPLEREVRKLKGVKWSAQHGWWYLPLTREAYRQVLTTLSPLAQLNTSAVKHYLEHRKLLRATLPQQGEAHKSSSTTPVSPVWSVSKENLEALRQFMQQLTLKAYCPSTQRTYRSEFLQLLHTLKEQSVETLTPEDIKRYLVYCMEKQGASESTVHSRLNALKFYFEQVLHREHFFFEIPRPKKAEQLPPIFSQDEVAAILNSVHNLKHKVMLMLAYSAGLRVSEVVRLQTVDIDSTRMTILIRQAKGKKDRIVALSPVLLVMLREYARAYHPNKKGYLFEGAAKGTPYSTRSLQEVLQAAKQRAGVLRPGSIHSLRHSFATHLLDRGTDVTLIQKLLGHSDLRTTLRYLHTTNKDLLKIVSPLDDLKLSSGG